ncbi:MAG TPA: protein kinase [Candidatus Krumholzibacteria bacterium]|nr:protein kinase [Candidatus Krumholzibacteria bacterium]
MIGHVVSHYRILQKMGGGGMGVVYRAEDLKLRRTVALKFLAPELTRDEDAKKRFLHEAQAASALDHPNICGIHEIDETPEGQLFIAMTCYDGESLKERIARRKLEVEESFQIAFAVAQGLGRAHASNIIHRDIKPANVMITSDGFVKIIDFGLSKLIGRSRVTGSGATLGTVAYMSPEQARSEEVDARVDIWALGAILYEMLTGRLPFRGEIDQAVVYSILNEDATPIKSIRPDVPDACVAIVMRCLAKDAADRYQSAEDFSVAVFEAGRKLGWADAFSSAGVRAVSVVQNRTRGQRGRVRPIFLVAAGCTMLAALFVWHPWQRGSIYTTQIRLAVVPLERLGDAPSQALVDGLSQYVAGAFDRASRTRPSMWVMPFARVLEDRPADLDRAPDAFGVNRLITGEVQRYGDAYRLMLVMTGADGRAPEVSRSLTFSLDALQRLPEAVAIAVAEMVGTDKNPATLAVIADPLPSSSRAWERFLEGSGDCLHYNSLASLDSARVALADAVRLAPTYAPALAAQGYCDYLHFFRSRDPADLALAEPVLRRAIAIDSTYVPASIYLAKVLAHCGQTDEGIALLTRVIRRDPDCIDAYQDLGNALSSAQRYDEAEAVYKALVARKPDYFHGYWRLGWLYSNMGRPGLEFAAHKHAIQLAPDDFRTLNSLGICYSELGDWRAAREYWERAFLIRPSCGSSSNVGTMLYYEGRFADSAHYYQYALEYCDTTDYSYWANLACALYWADGRREDAIHTYRKAIRLAEARITEVPDDIGTIARLADYHAMIGEDERAREMIERSSGLNDMEVYFRLACAYASMDDPEHAIDYIGKAVREHYPVHEIQREPLFRDLVRDPRLRTVLEKAARGRDDARG